MKSDHSFDQKGLYFAAKLAVVSVVIGGSLPYALSYSTSYLYPEPDPVVTLPQVTHITGLKTEYSTTTPERVLNTLSIEDVVPAEGKLIAADLVNMKLYLYEDGTTTGEFPIKLKGKAGTPWETPSGFYSIQTKEENHFSSIGKVYMPYSMQFYGNYFIHGMTYYPDGTPTSAAFSGGCIKLETDDAEKVFAFADVGTKVFVYDSKQTEPLPSLTLQNLPKPPITAGAYLVADIDTGEVYAEQNAQDIRPIASLTKVMTSLVANETISLDKKITITEGMLSVPQNDASSTQETFLVDDLFYPLLMQSNPSIAHVLADYYGRNSFVRWMNATAKALDMTSTSFTDATGDSADNTTTTEDMYRLATYLTNKKSFVLKILNTEKKTIAAEDGTKYHIESIHFASSTSAFKHDPSTDSSMLSVLSFKAGEKLRKVAVIVLDSEDRSEDMKSLANWITAAATSSAQNACVNCASTPRYRKIAL